MITSLGLLEFTSIAMGMQAADAMTKAAEVRLEEAKTICPGKYLVIVSGFVAAVGSAIQVGREVGGRSIIDELVLPSVHESVITGLRGGGAAPSSPIPVGVLEFFSVASAIHAADVAAKSANIEIIEVRLAMGIGGKSFVTMVGDLSSVTAAVDAGVSATSENGMLINKAIIASPTEEFFAKLL